LTLKFYKTVVCRVVSLVTALIAGCVSLKLFSHYLPVGVYGVVVVAQQILGYMPMVDGGFRTTTNREILALAAREDKLRMIRFAQTFYSHFTILFIPAALLLMVGYSLTPNVVHSGQPPLFFLSVGLAAAMSLLCWAQMELLIGLGQQARLFLMSALNSCILLGVLWISLYLGAGIWAFPLSSLGSACVCYPVALWLIRRQEPEIRFFCFRADAGFWSELRRLWPDAWSCNKQQVFILLLYSLDVVLVGVVCGSVSDAAVYAVVSRLISMARSLLQATGDAAWPIVAQKSGADHTFAAFYLRSNAWAFGAAIGAMALTLGPFINSYMSAQWAPPRILVVILMARQLVTGLSAPAGWLLLGAGAFKTIARYAFRELVGATILGVVLGRYFGMVGVAAGFLAATGLGTLFSLFYAYARSVKGSGGRMMWQAWWRGVLACAVSCSVAAALLPLAGNAWEVVAVGAAAALAGFGVGMVIGLVRFRSTGTGGSLRSRMGEVMANI
jgi:O-antigen/teichoic acid export membrane protein